MKSYYSIEMVRVLKEIKAVGIGKSGKIWIALWVELTVGKTEV